MSALNGEGTLPLLEFKNDGTYLDNKKLTYIKTFWMNADADVAPSVVELEVSGLKVDSEGEPIPDRHGGFEEYYINKYVMVSGLTWFDEESPLNGISLEGISLNELRRRGADF